MSATAQDTGAVVARAIQEINHIATLPEITLKIVELVESPTSTASDMQKLISNDPALCTRVLKVVNSAFYGLPGQIASIERAIVLLGLNAVKNIAVAASLVKLFRGGEISPEFSARDLWLHAVATATASKVIADELKMGMADEAFLAGLMHDIGVMVELQFDRQKMVSTLEKTGCDKGVPRTDMRAAETEVYGANHEQFGEGLCRKWKFPTTLSTVAGHHHEPMRLPEGQRTLACLVFVADHISAELGQGFRLDIADTSIPDDVLGELKLSRERLQAIKDGLPDKLQEVRRLLG